MNEYIKVSSKNTFTPGTGKLSASDVNMKKVSYLKELTE